MSGRPAVGPMLAMAERAEALGFSSVWVGDSLTARPRHEPLTLLAAAAGRQGWFPLHPRRGRFEEGWSRIRAAAREAGRSPEDITAALYTTLVLGEPARPQAELERFLSTYYDAPAAAMVARQACYA